MEASLVDRLKPGDHVCWTYASDRARREVTGAYVRAGLRDHHRVVYFADGPDRDAAVAGLAADGIDVAPALRAGQLQVMTSAAAYLSRGVFDAGQTHARWNAAVRHARAEGYAGLHALGDMSWAAGAVPGADRIGWFEQQLNRVFADGYGMAVCLYDRRRCGADLLTRVARAHPYTVTARPPDREPLLRMVRNAACLRLSGEADLSNRDSLATLLGHLLEDTTTPAVTIDLADLRFADASTCELIVDTGRSAHGRLRTRGARPQIHRLLTMVGAAAVPGLL
ncbi:MEDS domain-containing protein [Actinoplanes sp. NPDC051494]|uniref:MEDS domain-containing protein n=1 Tax=Actinoplanes sp. NPDC051494 TaxID=3363907 RepID=UPI00378AADD5